MCPECLSKEWRSKSFGLQSTHTGKQARGHPRLRDYICDLTWSRLGVEAAELREIAVDREVFRVLLGLLSPRLSSKEKRERKGVNELVSVAKGCHFGRALTRLATSAKLWSFSSRGGCRLYHNPFEQLNRLADDHNNQTTRSTYARTSTALGTNKN